MINNANMLPAALLAAIVSATGTEASHTYVTPKTPKEQPLTSDFVIRVSNMLEGMGDFVINGLDNLGIFGDLVQLAFGIDGMKSYSDTPSNALKDLWSGAAIMPGFNGGVYSTAKLLKLQLDEMVDKGIIKFDSPEDRGAFIAEFKEAIVHEGQPGRFNYEGMPDFVEHMSKSISDENIGVSFINKKGGYDRISDESSITVPYLGDTEPFLQGDDKIVRAIDAKPESDDEFVLTPPDQKALQGGPHNQQFDTRNSDNEGIPPNIDVSKLVPEASRALEVFINGVKDGLEFIRLNVGKVISLDSARLELGTDNPDLRLMTDEQGTIHAMRLSNPNTGVEIHLEPESFLEQTKLAFDATQPEAGLNVLTEVFRRAAENLPASESPELLAKVDQALQNEGLPPPSAAA